MHNDGDSAAKPVWLVSQSVARRGIHQIPNIQIVFLITKFHFKIKSACQIKEAVPLADKPRERRFITFR
jgi:hypothetical protein